MSGEPQTADWHDSQCGGWEGTGFDGEPLRLECDCLIPGMVAAKVAEAIAQERERLAAAVEARTATPEPLDAGDADFGEGAPNVDDERSLGYYDPNIGGYRVTPPVHGRPRRSRSDD